MYTSTNKTTIVCIETELFFFNSFFFLPEVDASHFYVDALAPGCCYSHSSTRTFRRALTASVDSCAEIKSCVTKSGRVWRKVPESGAQSVGPQSTVDKPRNGKASRFLWSGSVCEIKVTPRHVGWPKSNGIFPPATAIIQIQNTLLSVAIITIKRKFFFAHSSSAT